MTAQEVLIDVFPLFNILVYCVSVDCLKKDDTRLPITGVVLISSN